MRVLLASWAGRSHYFSLVPIGWALRTAGHDVRVISQPGFADTVTGSGHTMIPVGHDVDVARLLQENLGRKVNSTDELPATWAAGSAEAVFLTRARMGLGHFLTLADVMADDALEVARSWRPDVVVYEPTTFVGPLIGAVLGVPAVRHLWAPDFTADLPSIETELFAPLLERFGLDRLGVNGDATIDPCPPALQQPHLTDYEPMRYVPYNGGGTAAPVPARGDRPRVCVTWGLSQSELAISHTVGAADVLRAAADLPVTMVAPVGATAALGALPPHVELIDPMPLHALLEGCDLVVHHGGSGTLMTAMAAGVPQLVVPNMPDLAFNGRRIAATGAGVVRPAGQGDRDTQIATIVSDIAELTATATYRDAARGLRADNATRPVPAEVVKVLEALACVGVRPVRAGSSA